MADPVLPSNAAMAVAVSALKAQQARMQVIAENMANADSTSPVPGGDPYRRQVPVFHPKPLASGVQGVASGRPPCWYIGQRPRCFIEAMSAKKWF